MSTEFIRWLVKEANAGNWNGEKLGEAFCQLDSDNQLKLATVAIFAEVLLEGCRSQLVCQVGANVVLERLAGLRAQQAT